jgi:hypothetical protein
MGKPFILSSGDEMNEQNYVNMEVTTLKNEWREFFTAALAHNQEMKKTHPTDQRSIDLRITQLQVMLDTLDDCDPEVITKVDVFFAGPGQYRIDFARDMLCAMAASFDFPSPNAEAFIRELTSRLKNRFEPMTKKDLIKCLSTFTVPAREGEDRQPFPDDTPIEIGFRFSDDAPESLVTIGTVVQVWGANRFGTLQLQLELIGHEGCQRDQDKDTVTFNYHTAYAAAHKDDPKPAATDADTEAVDGFDALLRSMKVGLTGEEEDAAQNALQCSSHC